MLCSRCIKSNAERRATCDASTIYALLQQWMGSPCFANRSRLHTAEPCMRHWENSQRSSKANEKIAENLNSLGRASRPMYGTTIQERIPSAFVRENCHLLRTRAFTLSGFQNILGMSLGGDVGHYTRTAPDHHRSNLRFYRIPVA